MNLSKNLHPRIWEALNDYERTLLLPTAGRSSDERNRIQQHSRIWRRNYGRPFFLRVGVAVFALGAEVGLKHTDHALVLGAAAVCVGAFVESARYLMQNRRTASPDELRNLLPTLDLSPAELVYVDSMITLSELDTLEAKLKDQLAARLNELLSSHLSLESQRNLIRGSIEADTDPAALIAERDTLITRRQLTTDPIVAETLAKTIVAVDQRIESRKSLVPALERLDLQAQLISQTLASVQESLAALRAAPSALALQDTASLTEGIQRVNVQSRSIESAVNEIIVLEQRGGGESR